MRSHEGLGRQECLWMALPVRFHKGHERQGCPWVALPVRIHCGLGRQGCLWMALPVRSHSAIWKLKTYVDRACEVTMYVDCFISQTPQNCLEAKEICRWLYPSGFSKDVWTTFPLVRLLAGPGSRWCLWMVSPLRLHPGHGRWGCMEVSLVARTMTRPGRRGYMWTPMPHTVIIFLTRHAIHHPLVIQ